MTTFWEDLRPTISRLCYDRLSSLRAQAASSGVNTRPPSCAAGKQFVAIVNNSIDSSIWHGVFRKANNVSALTVPRFISVLTLSRTCQRPGSCQDGRKSPGHDSGGLSLSPAPVSHADELELRSDATQRRKKNTWLTQQPDENSITRLELPYFTLPLFPSFLSVLWMLPSSFKDESAFERRRSKMDRFDLPSLYSKCCRDNAENH